MQDKRNHVSYGYCQCGCGEQTSIARMTNRAFGHVRGQPVRFKPGHNGRRSPVQYKVEDRGYKTPCWIWQLATSKGYGRWGKRWAYKVMYERCVGPVADGLQLDHLCRTTECVNPEHLEPVTPSENRRRAGQERLTPGQIAEIRARLAIGDVTHSALGEEFGVSRAHISSINTGRRWTDG